MLSSATEMANETQTDIEKLNSFLRGELSAVETYEQAMAKIDDQTLRQQLQDLKHSHEMRAQKLSSRVRELGGEPDSSSGVWGAFAKLVQGGAKLFGKSATISTLEEGEDHGKRDYMENLEDLSPQNRTFIQSEIIPEQRRTHDVLSTLQNQV